MRCISVKISNKIFYNPTFCFESNSRTQNIFPISSFCSWFQEYRVLSLFEIVVPYHECICSLGASHCTITEIEFSHRLSVRIIFSGYYFSICLSHIIIFSRFLYLERVHELYLQEPFDRIQKREYQVVSL